MKYVRIAFLLSTVCSIALSQNRNIQLELGGKSVIYTLNYEELIKTTSKKSVHLSFGLGTLPLTNVNILSIPASVSVSSGQKKVKLDLSAGITYLRVSEKYSSTIYSSLYENSFQLLLSTGIGIRYEGEKFVFKSSFTPLFGMYASNKGGELATSGANNFLAKTLIFDTPVFPMIGITIGRKF